MKLSENTRKILDNFSKINNGLLFLKGKEQRTMRLPAGTFFGIAEIEEDIPQDFGIYNLAQFMSVLSLFVNPDISFEDENLIIEEGSTKVSYVFCSERLIQSPPRDKKIKLKEPLFSLNLSEDTIKRLMSHSKVMRLPHLKFECENGTKTISVVNKENIKSKDRVDETIGHDDEATDGYAYIDMASLTILPDDYTVTVSEKAISFKGQNVPVEYFAATLT